MNKVRFLKKGDWILIAVIAVALLLFGVFSCFLYRPVTNGIAEITVNGEVYGTYPLDQDKTLTLEGEGGHNRVEIGNGEVRIVEADCPDRLCVRQGAISRRGETVVCLPHGLVITVREGTDSDVDFITG